MRHIFIILLWVLTQNREFEKTFSFGALKNTRGWMYLDKMVLGQGKTLIKMQTQRVTGSPYGKGSEIVLNMIPEQRWQIEKKRKCDDIIRSPLLTHSLPLDGSPSVSEFQLEVPATQAYYFVLKDCRTRFLSQYTNDNLQVQLLLSVINNGSYMSEEQDHWYILPIILAVGFWLIFSNKDYMKLAPGEKDVDYAKMGLFCAIATNMSSLTWKSFGYLLYYYFGTDYLLFHLIYLFMHALSETLVISLLVMVAFGWSLNYLTGPNLDLAMPGFGFVTMMNIMTTLLTQLSNNDHDRHHVFDTAAGSVLIIERIVIGCIFFLGVIITYTRSRHKIKKYLIKFSIFGSIYICSVPLIILIANTYVPQSQRNEFVFIVVEGVKSLCNISLTYMVSSSKSQYNKLCYRNASFLPEDSAMF